MITNTHEAKTHLSKYLERVETGEEIIIARSGKPVARLVPMNYGNKAVSRDSMFEKYANKISLQNDWDSWPKGFLEAMKSNLPVL